ncbi:hypothetical protein DFR86_03500 [Acidianus sulfidivorans JP7]|uniref:ion channel n=1 Tax=Acidianus sulfidivorans TaxID=312539 RepID=UPI0014435891|nr:ion channel [Acidianus sulfidivorans]AWR96712.2 hypothetical protein DFR86_03500 [Acidianus sulfidivorans JP7]
MFLSVRSIASLLILFGVVLIGVVGNYILGISGNNYSQHMDLLNAIYFTIITLSTVGYGDIVPITPIAKIFDIILIIMGMGAFLTALSSISSDLAVQNIQSITEKIERIEEEFTRSHVLLIGSGPVNVNLVNLLKSKKEKYILLVSDKVEAEKFQEEGVKVFAINVISEEELSKFHPERAKLIVVDMKNTSDMIYTLVILSEVVKNGKIIAIVHDKDTEKRVQTLKKIKEIEVINPSEMIANQLMSNI